MEMDSVRKGMMIARQDTMRKMTTVFPDSFLTQKQEASMSSFIVASPYVYLSSHIFCTVLSFDTISASQPASSPQDQIQLIDLPSKLLSIKAWLSCPAQKMLKKKKGPGTS